MLIYPSLFGANPLTLGDTISQFDTVCSGYHIDIMDDHFVSNLSWGTSTVNAIAKATTRMMQLHLMVDDPAQWVDRVHWRAGDEMFFHIEAFTVKRDARSIQGHESPASTTEHSLFDYARAKQLCDRVRQRDICVGIAINPDTPVRVLEELLPVLDSVLVMSVVPGHCGQKFIEHTYEKIKVLNDLRVRTGLQFLIGVDGGVGEEQVVKLKQYNINFCTPAAAIFGAPDPVQAFCELQAVADERAAGN